MRKALKKWLITILIVILIVLNMQINKVEAIFTSADRPYNIEVDSIMTKRKRFAILDKSGYLWTVSWYARTDEYGIPSIETNRKYVKYSLSKLECIAIDTEGNLWQWSIRF